MRCAPLSMPTSAAIDREAALITDEARISITSAIGSIVTDNRDADPKRGLGSKHLTAPA